MRLRGVQERHLRNELVSRISKGYAIYDGEEEKYSWNACNTDDSTLPKLSAACEAYFTAEACFYECDVSVAKYRCDLAW